MNGNNAGFKPFKISALEMFYKGRNARQSDLKAKYSGESGFIVKCGQV